ncbi:MAG: GAF domain-containing protein [Chloroflexota bacterium]|nr:GAF domain-containing protein [Aggregatilineaceae bacterium]
MSESPKIHVLAAVTPATLSRYRQTLAPDPQIKLSLVTDERDICAFLAQPHTRADLLVLDSTLCDSYALINDLRQTYPRLLILLVDDGADFSTPGRADDVSIQPFEEGDLLRRIKRLAQERQLETLRADSLPPVRTVAQQLRRAGPGHGKQQAAVNAIAELGYDYVAYYALASPAPPELTLGAQAGPPQLTDTAPHTLPVDGTVFGWVAESGQSRVIGSGESAGHRFVERGWLTAGVCVPVGTSLRFGVLFAGRANAPAITEQHVKLLELIGAQLAHALAKQQT